MSVIDTATNTVTHTLRLWSGPVSPVAVAVAPNGTLLYITDTDGTILVFDTATNSLAGTPVVVGSSPTAAAASRDGTKVYIANFDSNSVSVIDSATNTVTNIAVGTFPNAVAVSPNGQLGYVANLGSGSVSVIDTATNTISDTISVGARPAAVAVSPDGAHLYVANDFSPFADSLARRCW